MNLKIVDMANVISNNQNLELANSVNYLVLIMAFNLASTYRSYEIEREGVLLLIT